MSAKFKRAATSKRDKYIDNFWENRPAWQDERDASVAEIAQAKIDSKKIEAKTPNQHVYLDALRSKQIVFVNGPAGTGKSYMAIGFAVQLYRQGVIKKIVISRPMVEAGRKMGAFPGGPKEKFEPYLRQQIEYLNKFMSPEEVARLIEDKTIEILPMELMRGSSFDDSFLILDESQNTEKEQMLMLITRLGTNSKFVICGDIDQNDLRLQSREYTAANQTGFAYAIRNLDGISDEIAVAVLTEDDILRNPLLKLIIKVWKRGR